MKMARLLVNVPVDDVLLIQHVRDHLAAVLEDRGTEGLNIAPKQQAEGEAVAELPGTGDRKGRVHWPAVSVVMAAERAPPAPKPAPRKK